MSGRENKGYNRRCQGNSTEKRDNLSG